MFRREVGPTILYFLAGAAVILVSVLAAPRIPVPDWAGYVLGGLFAASGLWLAGSAIREIGTGALGYVSPRADHLSTTGPYRLMRHPIYAGVTLILTGIAAGLRSWPGLLVVVALFVPAASYRARLEEEALAKRFGKEWQEYAKKTPPILPL